MEYQIIGVSKSKTGRWFVVLEAGDLKVSVEILDDEAARYGAQIGTLVSVALVHAVGDGDTI